MERKEFIQEVFLRAMTLPHVDSSYELERTVRKYLSTYDTLCAEFGEKPEPKIDEDASFFDPSSLTPDEQEFYFRFYKKSYNKRDLEVLWKDCKIRNGNFKEWLEDLKESDYVLAKPEEYLAPVQESTYDHENRRWVKHDTDKTRRMAKGQYSFDSIGVLQIFLEKNPAYHAYLINKLIEKLKEEQK